MENGFRLVEFMARVFRTRLECRFPRDRCVCESTYQETACAYSLREMDGASYHAASVDDCRCHIFVEIINGGTFVFTLGHCALL